MARRITHIAMEIICCLERVFFGVTWSASKIEAVLSASKNHGLGAKIHTDRKTTIPGSA